MDSPEATPTRWYQEVTAYQWLVLAIASAGWIFDVFEGQIYALTRDQMLAELLNTSDAAGGAKFWGDIFLAVFLIGGAFGGVMFGSLADRFGRKPTISPSCSPATCAPPARGFVSTAAACWRRPCCGSRPP